MSGVTQLSKIGNKSNKGRGNDTGGNRKESPVKAVEVHAHVMRREEHYVGRRAMDVKVHARRKTVRPKIIRLDQEKGLSPVRPCYMESHVIVHRDCHEVRVKHR